MGRRAKRFVSINGMTKREQDKLWKLVFYLLPIGILLMLILE